MTSFPAQLWTLTQSRTITAKTHLVLQALASFQGHRGLFPSHESIASRAGCSVRTVIRALETAYRLGIVQTLRAKGVSLVCTEQPVDTTTAAGKCFLDMLGVFAEFETNLRRERQMKGIQNAKAKGVYKGRPRQVNREEVRAMKESGMSAIEISNRLQIARTHVYRCLTN